MVSTRIRNVSAVFIAFAVIGALVWWFFFRAVMVPIAAVQAGSLPVQVHGPATLQARVATTVAARASGRIVKLSADQGQQVKAGTVLAMLDAEETASRKHSAEAGLAAARHQVSVARATVKHAQATLTLANQEFQRARQLYARGLVARAELDKSRATEATARETLAAAQASLKARLAEAARAQSDIAVFDTQLGYTRVTAPFAGLIVRRYAEPGQTVASGSPLFRLIDPTTLWVVMRVDESQSGTIQVGQPARIQLRTGAEVNGHVARIGLQSDSATRELEVDVALDKTPARYAIDEEARVVIRTASVKGIVFPASAVQRRHNTVGVLRINAGHAVFTPIQLGSVANGKAVATSGLQSGVLVLTHPRGIQSGTRVKPVQQASQ